MKAFYQMTGEEVLEQLGSGWEGLKSGDIAGRLEEFGPNVLPESRPRSRWSILFSQFRDVMIIILFIAAGISFFVGEHTDAMVILAIIVANAWMGYSQEYNAEQSMRMLRQMAASHALAWRDNNPVQVDAASLVPGDLIGLQAGDVVPADARLLEVNGLKTDEASLTGESHSMEKKLNPIPGENLVAGDQLNMAFRGTIVSNGSAKAVVTHTGARTELGKIAGMMETGLQSTPLQKRLAVFGRQLALIVVVICFLVFAFGIRRGEPAFRMFLTALSLAVAALPEALPAVITIALARGARRMVKQKALVRKLPAVETLGSVTYICTDKTGTLTRNLMKVEKWMAPPGREGLLREAMMLNNEVRFAKDGVLLGDSTETALVQHAMEQGLTREGSDKTYPIHSRLSFDSERMRMSTLHRHEANWILFVKGAPAKVTEVLHAKYSHQMHEWLEQNREWAAQGLRVLFFAVKVYDKYPGNIGQHLEKDLDFLGMAAMIDPPRTEVIQAISQCRQAGIHTVMITGDQALTAKAIARRLHIIGATGGHIRTGAELAKLDEESFRREVKQVRVYARVSPEQKLRIVKALQAEGEFVAMTGDGVNDAPSLKQADIGLAMGITGTDVAKEAADMILLDDNFATIVRAIKEGRRIYDNIKKFILYVLSCNLCEILTIFLAPVIGFPIPLLPIHILWINLVTDGLPGIALVAEPAEKNIMQKPPRPPEEKLFAGGLVPMILFSALVMTAATLSIQWWAMNEGYPVPVQQSMVFTTLCFVQLGNALSVRSVNRAVFSFKIFSNRGMWIAVLLTIAMQLMLIYLLPFQSIFHTAFLSVRQMAAVLALTFGSIIFIELLKWISRKRNEVHSE